MRCESILLMACLACASSGGVHAAPVEGKPVFSAQDLALPGKKGACFTLREPGTKQGATWTENISKTKALNVSWNYSWGSTHVPVQPANIEFVPMTWSARDADRLRKQLARDVLPEIKGGRVKRLLGFNEPDHTKQANLSYQEAIDYWPILESMGVPLCSPACGNPEGIDDPSAQGIKGTWMRDFMNEASRRNYRVDYVGVHWYGGTSVTHFKAKMRRIYEKYGQRPLLITEFAPADWRCKSVAGNRHTPAKVLAFMKDVLPWMESQEWIAGYAWFSFGIDRKQGTSSALFDKQGKLTACGRYYKSVTPENPTGDQEIMPDPPRK